MHSFSLKIKTLTLFFFFYIPQVSYAQEVLVLAIHPYLTTTELEKKFNPLVNYLSQKTGFKIQLKIGSSYDEHIKYIGLNKVDIAYMGPASYIKLVEQYGSKPILAKLEINGQSFFQGNIIVRKGSDIMSLADLKGKKIALGNINSTMSYIVPHHQLHQADVYQGSHNRHPLLSSHDDIALAVLSGDFDAGAVKPAVFKRYEQEGLRVLTKTQEISEHLFVVRSRLPKKIINRLRDTLLDMKSSKEGLNVLKGIKKNMTALVEANDRDYQNLRIIIQDIDKLHLP